MDDAGGGHRGLRARPSPELFAALRLNHGIVPDREPVDLGGSSNLNLLLVQDGRKLVARVYRPSVSVARLTDIQRARCELAERGFPCAVPIPGRNGSGWARAGDHLLEVEEYVDSDGHMDTWERVEHGLRILGSMHEVLKSVATTPEGGAPRFVNYISPHAILDATARGARRLRFGVPSDEEGRLADTAEDLARMIAGAQQTAGFESLPRQLVHGDFWDNNVLFLGEGIVLIHDFDHMGNRARIDDLALTLYYMNSEPGLDTDSDRRRARLRRLVDAYDAGLNTPLSRAERLAIPIALARQPLWSVGGWIATLDSEVAARKHAAGMNAAVEFALGIMWALPEWQAEFD